MAVKDKALSNFSEEELLSVFVPSDSARHLIHDYSSLYNLLVNASEERLGTTNGVGKAKLKKLLCIREVMNRIQQEKSKEVKSITGTRDVKTIFRFLEDVRQEEFWALLLNTKNAIIKRQLITKGTINASLAAPRELFCSAVQNMAAGIIVVHNHPSGDPAPSQEDEAVTKRLIEAGKLLDIPLLDHMIMAKQGCYSFREQHGNFWIN